MDVDKHGIANVLVLKPAQIECAFSCLLQLEHVPLNVFVDEVLGRTFSKDLTVVDDDQSVAQPLRLVHVMRRQQQGFTLHFEV